MKNIVIKLMEKFNKDSVFTLLYYSGKTKNYFVKRFVIETSIIDRKFNLIPEYRGSKLNLVSSSSNIKITYNYWTKKGEKK